jgi:prefoldin subunit 5
MKVIGFTTVVAGLAVTVGGILYATGPGFRTSVNQHVHNWIGWTEAARQADPVGFTNQVEASLQQDLATLHSTRDELNKEVGDLGREIRKHQALAEHAERLAAEFRQAFRQAKKRGGFPVTVRAAAYTAEQVESQVSLLLAEAKGYRTTLAKLEKIRQQAEEKLEALAVRINTTQAQLAMLPTQRELLRARVLSDAGEQLVAQVEGLLEGNRQVVRGNPVRSVAELIAASTEDAKPRSRLQAARDYLAADVDEAAPSPSDDVAVAEATGSK